MKYKQKLGKLKREEEKEIKIHLEWGFYFFLHFLCWTGGFILIVHERKHTSAPQHINILAQAEIFKIIPTEIYVFRLWAFICILGQAEDLLPYKFYPVLHMKCC